MNFNSRLREAVANYACHDIDVDSKEYKQVRSQVSLLESTKILLKESNVLTEATLQDIVSRLVIFAQRKGTGEVGPNELFLVCRATLRGEKQFESQEQLDAEAKQLTKEILQGSSDILQRELAAHRVRLAMMNNIA